MATKWDCADLVPLHAHLLGIRAAGTAQTRSRERTLARHIANLKMQSVGRKRV